MSYSKCQQTDDQKHGRREGNKALPPHSNRGCRGQNDALLPKNITQTQNKSPLKQVLFPLHKMVKYFISKHQLLDLVRIVLVEILSLPSTHFKKKLELQLVKEFQVLL